MKPNSFRLPHKYYRHLWSTTLDEIGRLDFTEDEDIEEGHKLFSNLTKKYLTLHSNVENEMGEILIQPKDDELFQKWIEEHGI